MKNNRLHEVVMAAIVVKDGKYLIIKRSEHKKRFPNMWTIPGGKLEPDDYIKFPKDTENYWYNVLEKTLHREVKEEVGINIYNIEYVTSLATIHKDGTPSIAISCVADYSSGDVVLDLSESSEYRWVDIEEAKRFAFIDGIYEELLMVEDIRKGKKIRWIRKV